MSTPRAVAMLNRWLNEKSLDALLVFNVVFQRHARRFGYLQLRQPTDLPQIANSDRDRLNVVGHLKSPP